MSLPRINLVVVGHKDHGKSTLIGRLLYDSNAIPEQKLQEIRDELKNAGKSFEFAYILDSLEEERRGGLTIDIMQTPFKSKKYHYTIIDCPGHKEFIQKMLTGASQADAAVLVASVKDGIQDQTREHLFLVKTLGIRQLVVAANKMDAVDYDMKKFLEFQKALEETLSPLGYEGAPVVPVSALEGENVIKPSERMKWYKGKPLIEVLDETVKPPKPLREKPLRCIVQDVYELEGQKLAVCKVETGTLKVGQTVTVMPTAKQTVIKGIRAPHGSVMQADPGDSIGVSLRDTSDLKRGYVLAAGEALKPTGKFLAEIIIFGDLTLKPGSHVQVRLGTAEVECEVEEILEKIDPVKLTIIEKNPRFLESGMVGKAAFKPLSPLYAEEYSSFPELGRFVIVGKTGASAAGIILKKN